MPMPLRVSIVHELIALKATGYVPAYWIAQAYVGMGDISTALAWMATAFTERCSWRFMAGADPKLRPLTKEAQIH